MSRHASDTPIMRQYWAIKHQHPREILFFHMGDFYEMFYEDAETAARTLGIALTSRSKGADAVPMAGVPCHAAEAYVARLVKAGHRVAICEQAEEAGTGQGILPREVTRTVSAGTLVDERTLAEKEPLYCLAAVPGKGRWGLAWADLSTGSFQVTEIPSNSAADGVARLGPAECLVPERMDAAAVDALRGGLPETPITPFPDFAFGRDTARDALHTHFGVATLDGFGCQGLEEGISAAGALIRYLQETQKGSVRQITRLVRTEDGDRMRLNNATCRSLDLVASARGGGREGSLLWVLDRTETAMGGREIRQWLLEPLVSLEEIRRRQAAVGVIVEDLSLQKGLRASLARMGDVERLAGRIASGRTAPRDLVALKEALQRVPAIRDAISSADSEGLRLLSEGMDPLPETADLVGRAIADRPPATLKDGGVIRDGYHPEIDSLRLLAREGSAWMAAFQVREAERTGISNLKVGYHRVFGYYIEVSRTQSDRVPEEYHRKQTLKSVERYVTQELREHERKVLSAGERIRKLEAEVFGEIREAVARRTESIQRTGRAIAGLDALVSLARVAVEEGYVRPEVDGGGAVEIRAGRHPVLEKTLVRDPFVPNDVLVDGDGDRLLLITGPNMAGKSTYIRQVALTVILAQMGSFVPAEKARIGIADRIFTRVGASDEIARGASTFMVEMTETAEILHGATDRSLVILDEVGRGTSTYDGLSIAWAISEHLARPGGPRTLFATHYHELTRLAETIPGIRNLHAEVRESGEDVIFLRQIRPGSTDRSYGIHVAKLAGVPAKVLGRAKSVLKKLEDAAASPGAPRGRRSPAPGQGNLTFQDSSGTTEDTG